MLNAHKMKFFISAVDVDWRSCNVVGIRAVNNSILRRDTGHVRGIANDDQRRDVALHLKRGEEFLAANWFDAGSDSDYIGPSACVFSILIETLRATLKRHAFVQSAGAHQ